MLNVTWELNPTQWAFVAGRERFSFYVGGIGAGKALALDTPVPTPTGWTTTGELLPGDTVFDERGVPCHVTFATEVMEGRLCYRVTFSDGTTIIADADHSWLTWTCAARRNAARNITEGCARAQSAVVTTEHISQTLMHRKQLNHGVPVAGSLKLPNVQLPIDPYVLGVWLGDGTAINCHITSVDEGILDEIRAAGYAVELVESTVKSARAPSYAVGKSEPKRDAITGRMQSNESLTSALRKLRLLGNKHIPPAYLRASAEQRLSLLQGLMDADGYADTRGKCEFYTTNLRLADDAYELCSTLGLKASRRSKPATLNGVRYGTVHILAFTPYVPVFRLHRKSERLHAPGAQAKRQGMRYITSVEACPSVPVRCIQVDSPHHLYLVSKAFIPTHNTFAGAARAITRMIEQPGSLGLIGAPTYPMLHDATERTFFALLPAPLIHSYNKSEGVLRLTNGSEALFRSLDIPDRARGLNLAWFWLDEAPLCGYYAWQVLKGRLRQKRFTTGGWATGTPKGRDEFARDFELAPLPGHALFRASTYANAHNLPPGYIAELGYTGAFAAQEILGQFVAFEGLVYAFDANPTSPTGHVREPRAGVVWSEVVGGVDWGYTNPAAGLVFGLDGNGRAWQLDEFYQRRAALEETLLPALLELTRRYGVRRWFCGPDEPEHIDAFNAALAREGLRAQALRADNAVRAGIQTVTGLLARRDDGGRGLYVAPRCVHTLAEFASYQYAPAGPGSHTPSETPLKQNDHALDALRYALYTALGQSRTTSAYLAAMQRRVEARNMPPARADAP